MRLALSRIKGRYIARVGREGRCIVKVGLQAPFVFASPPGFVFSSIPLSIFKGTSSMSSPGSRPPMVVTSETTVLAIAVAGQSDHQLIIWCSYSYAVAWLSFIACEERARSPEKPSASRRQSDSLRFFLALPWAAWRPAPGTLDTMRVDPGRLGSNGGTALSSCPQCLRRPSATCRNLDPDRRSARLLNPKGYVLLGILASATGGSCRPHADHARSVNAEGGCCT